MTLGRFVDSDSLIIKARTYGDKRRAFAITDGRHHLW
jgi:hypothetical protein